MAATKAELLKEIKRLRGQVTASKKLAAQSKAALAEALEQEGATSEILRVMSQSPIDVQPVFDAVAASAARLCESLDANIFRRDGDRLVLVAHHGPIRVGAIGEFTIPLIRGTAAGRAVLDGRAVHVADMQTEGAEFPEGMEIARGHGDRTILGVPLIREGIPIGVIVVRRVEARLFTDRQVALLQTFADQAVIAIENVRLFTELQEKNGALTQAHAQVTEALEQQTATADILKVISSSPTDARPVFDAIATNAAHLCDANDAQVLRVEGEVLRLVAAFGAPSMPSERRLTGGHLVGRAVIDRKTIHVRDLAQALAEYSETTAARYGVQSALAVPLLREGVALGVIRISRTEVQPFTDKQIALVQTFADQAVIAIENVRLFKELEARNRDLTKALEQQVATAEILKVISSSPTDMQPIFDAIIASAVRLCNAQFGWVHRFDGEMVHFVAHRGLPPEALAVVQGAYPMRPDRTQVTGRAILVRNVVVIEDQLADPEYRQDFAAAEQTRSALAVPMLRDGEPLGVIVIKRTESGPFPDEQIALLQTFADQAVIAIENARLFKELQARTHDLTRSVGELKALGEVGQAISSTLDLQTVLRTIVARATQLSGTDAGVIYEYDELREVFLPRATEHLEAEIVATMLATPVRKGEGATGRLAEGQDSIQLPDILDAPAESRVRSALVRAGYRALLAIPLVREDHLIGGLTVIRRATGEFAPEVIDLLRTFATQSALAIQNARLFREIEEKSRQLEAASRHKSEFLSNMSHELRTPLNAIIGFSEVLGERMFGELTEKQEEYLNDIMESGRHLLSLINDILDLSKIEAGRMELELTEFDLPQAIDNALTLVRERAGRRGIALHQAMDERLGRIRGDERKVKQVLLNLLSNALKFTPEGGRIDVSARLQDGSAEISVADTGVGIAPEDQEAVFEEFRQVGTAAKKVEGTGLGLALSRKFVALHGGRIWVNSQVGVGSTFTFTLPVRRGG
jgi:two-component system, NtrC family, sensor kinase